MKVARQSGLFSFRAKLLVLLWLVTLPLVNPWVRGDGVGYYAYAHALLIRGDLNFQNEWLHGNASFRMNRVDAQGRLNPDQFTANGHVANHFAVGTSILWAPFLIVVHGVVLALDHLGWQIAADGYSKPYLVTMALATAGYGFLALWLGFLLAREYFGEPAAFVATLAIWFGSSLPVYMYFNPSWAHAPAAFSVALFLWYWHRTRSTRTLSQWVLLGLLGGLMVDVYYLNIVLLILPLADALGDWRRWLTEENERRGEWQRGLVSQVLFAVAVLVAFLPTLVTRAIIYGRFFRTGYGESWYWTAPRLLKVLFSRDHGLFSWTPLIALAVVGLFALWKKDRRQCGLLVLIFLLFYYLVACYQNWAGISSFGNRFFLSLTPVFVIGLAGLLDAVWRWSGERRLAWRGSCALLALLVMWNLGLIFQWGTQLIPERGPVSWRQVAYNQVEVVPREAAGQLARYFRNRRGMMRRIEKRDVKSLQAKPRGPVPAPPRAAQN
jgi:hypothetical protein